MKPTGFCVLDSPMLWFLPLPPESWAPGSVLEGKGAGRFSEVMSLSRDLNFGFGLSSFKCVPSSCPVVPNTVLGGRRELWSQLPLSTCSRSPTEPVR